MFEGNYHQGYETIANVYYMYIFIMPFKNWSNTIVDM